MRFTRSLRSELKPACESPFWRFRYLQADPSLARKSGPCLLKRRSPVAAFPESYMILVMSNIVSGRQIRAARMLAGLTQADLARAAGCHPRSVRYCEDKGSNTPTNFSFTLDSIEQALNLHGVIPFSTPTPGVRCSS